MLPVAQAKTWQDVSFYSEDPRYTSVTNKLGPLVIEKSIIGQMQTVELKKVPWSSWWWPTYEQKMFNLWRFGTNISPLGKYDSYVDATRGRSAGAANYEKDELYDPRAVGWQGLCDAWSIASILHPEPKKPKTVAGIDFAVRDLKALLLKTYEVYDNIDMYGVRNNSEWNDIYSDIYPDQLHRFLQYYAFKLKKNFIIDTDASHQVWNHPVYKVQMRMKRDASDSKLLQVKLWLHMATPFVEDPDFVGTKTSIKKYTYQLHIQDESDEMLVIKKGEWTDRSRWDHPDYVLLPEMNVKRGTMNKKVSIGIVDTILK
jgi:hypothetical protein